ncbi:hypothetical protein, partial [Actinomadura rugatobispora]
MLVTPEGEVVATASGEPLRPAILSTVVIVSGGRCERSENLIAERAARRVRSDAAIAAHPDERHVTRHGVGLFGW